MNRSEETKCSKTSFDSQPNEEGEEESKLKESMAESKDGGSSSNSTIDESNKKPSVRPYVRSKLPRLRWTNDLHLRFVQAVERLGGQDRATPKLVLQLMNVKGLHIAHVKSHLQMYRSKKMDYPSQEADPRIESGDRNIFNLSQLPMLQCYNRTNNPSFRYEDATVLFHRDWMRSALREHWSSFENTNPRFYNTATDKLFAINHARQENHRLQTNHMPLNEQISLRIQDVNDKFGSAICQKKMEFLQERQSIPLDLESTSLQKHIGTNTKVFDLNLDLNLSLGVQSRNLKCFEEEDVDDDKRGGEEGNLALSLMNSSCSFSRNKKRLIREEDDHMMNDEKKAKRTSTLDLTI